MMDEKAREKKPSILSMTTVTTILIKSLSL